MTPRVLQIDSAEPDLADLEVAAEALRAGRLVAFPTETVYGLGAHAHDTQAVQRIFAVKRRPPDNPLIVHVSSLEQAQSVVASMSPLAEALAQRFWPGPLTLVLEANASLPSVTTGGLSTVAVRMPSLIVAVWLLKLAGVPVAAPSANRSGRPSPTRAQDVLDDLGDEVDVIVDAGPSHFGVESTVIDARGDTPVILREGALPRELLGVTRIASSTDLAASPGTRYRHYAPACAVEVVPRGEGPARAAALAEAAQEVGLVAFSPAPDGVVQVGVVTDAEDLGRHLYQLLRAAEVAGVDTLVVEAVEETGIGRAVMDRLLRAAGDYRGGR